MTLEQTILSALVYQEQYARNVMPFMEPDYFKQPSEQLVVGLIRSHYNKFQKIPTAEILKIELDSKPINATIHEQTHKVIDSLKNDNQDLEWLMQKSEEFCRNRAIHNALYKCVKMFQDKKATIDDLGVIPKLLTDATAVSFDNRVGHDFIDDAESRFDFYHDPVQRVEFDLDWFNQITKGGIPRKTMLVLLGGTGGGKSLTMCHMAGSFLMQGKNVVYITLEMSEEFISQRVDMNLLDVTEEELMTLSKESYLRRIDIIKGKTGGHFVTMQYPPRGAHSGHIRRFLHDLFRKRGIRPDVLIVDYLNIAASATQKASGDKYDVTKSVAEETRGLGVEFDCAVITATQVNRDGFGSTEIDLTNTADSFGIPFTADYMAALWATEEMIQKGQMGFGELKTRYGSRKGTPKKTIVGVNFGKQKLFNIENATKNVEIPVESSDSVFDNTEFSRQAAVSSSEMASKVKDIFA